MQINPKIATTLIKKLKQFGLNPNNWMLAQTEHPNHWYIINTKNKHFRLRGISSFKRNGQTEWKDIQMTSF